MKTLLDILLGIVYFTIFLGALALLAILYILFVCKVMLEELFNYLTTKRK